MARVVEDLKEVVFDGFNWVQIRKAIQQSSTFITKKDNEGQYHDIDIIKSLEELTLKLYMKKYKDLYYETTGKKTDLSNLRDRIAYGEDYGKFHFLDIWEKDLEKLSQLKLILIDSGFLVEDDRNLELTDKFNLLLKQKNQKRISLKAACDKLAKAIKTAYDFNMNESNRNPVKLIVLYGSSSKLESEVGDLDLHITTTERLFDTEYADFRANDRKLTLSEKPSLLNTPRQFSASSEGYAKQAIVKTTPYIDADDSIPLDELISNGALIVFCDTPVGCKKSEADAKITEEMHSNLKKLCAASESKQLLDVSQLLLERD